MQIAVFQCIHFKSATGNRLNIKELNPYRLIGMAAAYQLLSVTLNKGIYMLSYAITFLIIAIIAGVLGFVGIAGLAAEIAKVLFFVFLVLFIISLIAGRTPRV